MAARTFLYTVTIQGLAPLLMHKFPDEIASNGTEHRGEKVAPREEAEKFAYRAEDRELFIPGPAVFKALVEAGRFHKLGKNKMTTHASSLVPACLVVTDLAILLGTKEFEVDSRRVVNQVTRGAHIAHRPRLDKWKATFHMEVDEATIPESKVRELVDDAGSKIGVGAFRPEKKGPFGRFVVVGWKKEAVKTDGVRAA